MRVTTDQGLSVNFNGLSIGLDHQQSSNNLVFISHAHTDHLVKNPRKPIITSGLTASLASLRVNSDYELVDLPGASLIESGHVLGGKSLFLDGAERLLYTGDFSPHDRFFLKGLKPVKCDTLVIETTYGLPDYDFPDPLSVLLEARKIIQQDLFRGDRVVLWGYAFGKAQLLMKLVEGLGPLFADEQVRAINSVCRSHGFDLLKAKPFSNDFRGLYITSNRRELNRFTADRVYSFTGWGARGVSNCFRVSDHASFSDLLRFVKGCNPQRVYCHHGFSEEFASLLRVEGFDALAI